MIDNVSRPTITPIRLHQDYLLMLFLALAALSFAAVLVLVIGYITTIILLIFDVYVDQLVLFGSWYLADHNGLITSTILLLGGLSFAWLARVKARSNRALYVEAGCPQCHNHDFKRVRRSRRYRLLGMLDVPLKRYSCKHCFWRGSRLSDRKRRRRTRAPEQKKAVPSGTRRVNEEEAQMLREISSLSENHQVGEDRRDRDENVEAADIFELGAGAISDNRHENKGAETSTSAFDLAGPSDSENEEEVIFNPLTLTFEKKPEEGE